MEDRKDKYTGHELLSEIKKFYEDGLNIDNIKKKIKANEPSDMENFDSRMAKRRIAILDCVSHIDKKVQFSIGYSPQQDENYNRPIVFVLHINFIELSKINRILRHITEANRMKFEVFVS